MLVRAKSERVRQWPRRCRRRNNQCLILSVYKRRDARRQYLSMDGTLRSTDVSIHVLFDSCGSGVFKIHILHIDSKLAHAWERASANKLPYLYIHVLKCVTAHPYVACNILIRA